MSCYCFHTCGNIAKYGNTNASNHLLNKIGEYHLGIISVAQCHFRADDIVRHHSHLNQRLQVVECSH